MSRLFADAASKDLEEQQLGAGMCLSVAFVLLIPISGFFWFVWEPLGKGLMFVAVFTFVWSAAMVLSIDKELESRKTDG